MVNALRVGLFTECYRPIQNGIVASVDALAKSLRSHGHDYVFVTPEMPGFDDSRNPVVRVPSLPLPTRTAYRLTVPYLPRTLGALSIVHTHSPFVTGWLGARAARRNGVPLVFTYHTQLEAYAHYVPFETHATRGVATQLTRAYANGADAVIVPTPAMERHLRGLGVSTRIEVVPSGIDCAQFARGQRRPALRAHFGVFGDAHMILSVGRLGREKNIELALEAFALHDDPQSRLVIVGDGPHRETLERLASHLGIAGRTTFAGEFARDALPDVYASADAFVFTSLSDTQGLVLVEALAAGLPIVAVDTPQTADVLAGTALVSANDARSVAATLREVLAGRGPAAELRRAVARNYDGETLGVRVISLYESLLTPKPAAELAGVLR